MVTRRLSRRDFLRWSAILGGGSILSACAPTTPTMEPTQPPAAQTEPTATQAAQPAQPTATPPPPEPTATSAPQPTATPAPPAETTFIFPIASEPPGIDPCNPWFAGSAMGPFLSLFYDGWLYTDKEGVSQPWMLKSYERKDETTWSMEMEKGIRFHSGREATAEDVQRCWERFIKEDLGCASGDSYRSFGEYVKATGDYTFEVKTKEPRMRFLNVMGLVPTLMDMDVVNAYDKGPVLLQAEAGTGPWVLDKWEPQTYISMRRFDGYWAGKPPFRLPKINNLQAVVVPDTQAQLAALRTGKIHVVTGLSVDQFKQIEAENRYRTFNKPSTGYYRLNVNWFRIQDDNIRQALRYGINREMFVEALTQGLGQVSGPISPVVKSYALPQDELMELQKYDPELAKEYLKKAGYDENNRLRLELIIIANWSNWLDIAQIVQANYKEVGIDIEIRIQEVGVWVDSRIKQKDYDLSVNDMGTSFDPDLYMYHSTRDEQAWTGGGLPEIDKLLEEGLYEDNLEKRVAIYRDLQRVMIERVREIWLYTAPTLEVWSEKVKGDVNWPTGLNWRVFDMEDVTIEA